MGLTSEQYSFLESVAGAARAAGAPAQPPPARTVYQQNPLAAGGERVAEGNSAQNSLDLEGRGLIKRGIGGSQSKRRSNQEVAN
eukprot:COSAG01_NODE_73190_length_251_cov_0.486842_1_plen_83_part_11